MEIIILALLTPFLMNGLLGIVSISLAIAESIRKQIEAKELIKSIEDMQDRLRRND